MSNLLTNGYRVGVEAMTAYELAKRLGHRKRDNPEEVSTKRLANMRSEGIGPRYVKVGGRILYPVNEVDAWLDRSLLAS